jgi:segregation and condensation protein A
MTFETKLEVFEGPLDLLLHLIQINEVEISDIPIASITEQYLEYLDLMKALDVNVAGDFLVMASTLMHIKSKMLLPKRDDELEEAEDLRELIVTPLMEYLQLKEAAGELASRDMLDRDVFRRGIEGNGRGDEEAAISMTTVNLYDLMDAFKKVIKQRHPGRVLRFRAEAWSVKEKIAEIRTRLKEAKKLHFRDLFSKAAPLSEMIATFLALLELIRVGFVAVFQKQEGSDIVLKAAEFIKK